MASFIFLGQLLCISKYYVPQGQQCIKYPRLFSLQDAWRFLKTENLPKYSCYILPWIDKRAFKSNLSHGVVIQVKVYCACANEYDIGWYSLLL